MHFIDITVPSASYLKVASSSENGYTAFIALFSFVLDTEDEMASLWQTIILLIDENKVREIFELCSFNWLKIDK